MGGISDASLNYKVKSFENGILVGEIINVNADESILTDGHIDPRKLKPISFFSHKKELTGKAGQV